MISMIINVDDDVTLKTAVQAAENSVLPSQELIRFKMY